MSKKALCLCMVVVLAIGLAIPTFALIEPTGDFADWIFGWQGSGQTALLKGHGINNSLRILIFGLRRLKKMSQERKLLKLNFLFTKCIATLTTC